MDWTIVQLMSQALYDTCMGALDVWLPGLAILTFSWLACAGDRITANAEIHRCEPAPVPLSTQEKLAAWHLRQHEDVALARGERQPR